METLRALPKDTDLLEYISLIPPIFASFHARQEDAAQVIAPQVANTVRFMSDDNSFDAFGAATRMDVVGSEGDRDGPELAIPANWPAEIDTHSYPHLVKVFHDKRTIKFEGTTHNTTPGTFCCSHLGEDSRALPCYLSSP